ncbi:hypothetical protein BSK48_16965 [Paenibacillus odorifer]|uniref:hypothetical protein n=1 Tax=Paenibacillus odorifer TaxID=189426 RepID=UPI00096EFB7E|nr:hypothetical protein [Paenibacillus odorifer]OMD69167.1 hypothetical protein BSK48_16965 [Paenibacillus odorifer]
MSKLTEIKEYVNGTDEKRFIPGIRYFEDVSYLLSLLEEKEKALTFYANENRTFEEISDDGGFIARKALNTSSNNEGES